MEAFKGGGDRNVFHDQEEETSVNPLTNQEIRAQSGNWSLAGDLGLLGNLKEFSNNLLSRTESVSQNIDNLVYEAKNESVKVSNVVNDLQMLANSQFIESRVYDEEVEDPLLADNSPGNISGQSQGSLKEPETDILPKIKRSLAIGIKFVDQTFEEILKPEGHQIDSDEEEEEYLLQDIATALQSNSFTRRPMPFIIGSEDFNRERYVGLMPPTEEAEKAGNEKDSDKDEDISEPSDEDIPVQPFIARPPFLPPRIEPIANFTRSSSPEEEDFFKPSQVIHSPETASLKSDRSSSVSVKRPQECNSVNLFGDDGDDESEDLFTKKPSKPVFPGKPSTAPLSGLFEDIDVPKSAPVLTEKENVPKAAARDVPKPTSVLSEKEKASKTKATALFDDEEEDEEDDLFGNISRSNSRAKPAKSPPKGPQVAINQTQLVKGINDFFAAKSKSKPKPQRNLFASDEEEDEGADLSAADFVRSPSVEKEAFNRGVGLLPSTEAIKEVVKEIKKISKEKESDKDEDISEPSDDDMPVSQTRAPFLPLPRRAGAAAAADFTRSSSSEEDDFFKPSQVNHSPETTREDNDRSPSLSVKKFNSVNLFDDCDDDSENLFSTSKPVFSVKPSTAPITDLFRDIDVPKSDPVLNESFPKAMARDVSIAAPVLTEKEPSKPLFPVKPSAAPISGLFEDIDVQKSTPVFTESVPKAAPRDVPKPAPVLTEKENFPKTNARLLFDGEEEEEEEDDLFGSTSHFNVRDKQPAKSPVKGPQVTEQATHNVKDTNDLLVESSKPSAKAQHHLFASDEEEDRGTDMFSSDLLVTKIKPENGDPQGLDAIGSVAPLSNQTMKSRAKVDNRRRPPSRKNVKLKETANDVDEMEEKEKAKEWEKDEEEEETEKEAVVNQMPSVNTSPTFVASVSDEELFSASFDEQDKSALDIPAPPSLPRPPLPPKKTANFIRSPSTEEEDFFQTSDAYHSPETTPKMNDRSPSVSVKKPNEFNSVNLFDDCDDDGEDLFAKTSSKPVFSVQPVAAPITDLFRDMDAPKPAPVLTEKVSKKTSKVLFDDDEEEDLFGNTSRFNSREKEPPKPAMPLAKEPRVTELFAGTSKSKSNAQISLFATDDEEDDDTDLFSSPTSKPNVNHRVTDKVQQIKPTQSSYDPLSRSSE